VKCTTNIIIEQFEIRGKFHQKGQHLFLSDYFQICQKWIRGKFHQEGKSELVKVHQISQVTRTNPQPRAKQAGNTHTHCACRCAVKAATTLDKMENTARRGFTHTHNHTSI
jgi:hypothetical protein